MISKKSIPWPTITTNTGEIPMGRKYGLRDMSYLDTLQARPIFEKQADIIIKNNYKGLVDIGCRHGPINDFLKMKNYEDYQYYGFDTSPEPIEYAQQRWTNKNNIEVTIADINGDVLNISHSQGAQNYQSGPHSFELSKL